MPDHRDLTTKLDAIPQGNKVYVAFLGKMRVKTKTFPKGRDMARYLVGDLGSPDSSATALVRRYAAELRGKQEEEKEEVPF